MVTEDKLELVSIISELSKVRKLFHSEADFQFALAWEIHKNPGTKVRLEKKMTLPNQNDDEDDKNLYIDIWVEFNRKKYGIELKYKTKKVDIELDGERYILKEQAAQDFARYDYLKDVHRLEEFKEKKQIDKINIGYAVFLTNDHLYWGKSKRADTANDKDFRIYEGRTIAGGKDLSWRHKDEKTKKIIEGPSDFVKKNPRRKGKILLKQDYKIKWQIYNEEGHFKYLLLGI